jgi:hypothetical protein
MKEKHKINEGDNLLACISVLSRNDVNRIFIELCEEYDLLESAIEMVKSCLADIGVNEIVEQVFKSLNGIQIEEFWNNSEKSYWGYQEPTEVAYDMIHDAISHYVQKMKDYRNLGMKKEEKTYCMGIISGLLRYGIDGTNEFHEAVPDDPYTIADDMLYDWKKENPNDVTDVQEVYDSYFSEVEPDDFAIEEV